MSSAPPPDALEAAIAAEDHAWIAVLTIGLVMSVTALVVGLRIYTRRVLIKHLGWDDYLVVLSLIVGLIDVGLIFSTIPYGLGRHTATLDQESVVDYLRLFWASIVFYNICLTLIKLTFLFQYERVLSVHKMKMIIRALGTIIMLWAVSQVLIVVFSCNPIAKFWQRDLPGTCMPNIPFWYINAAGNIITDLAIFIMPLPVLSKLQLHKKQKYFVMGIFSLGFFTCLISLIRLAYLKQGPDFTFDNIPSAIWSVIELCCGMVCASLPTLRPLMTKIKPRWMVSYSRSRNRTNGGIGQASHGGGKQGFAGGKSAHEVHTHSIYDKSTTLSSTHDSYRDMEEPERSRSIPMSSYRRPSESVERESMAIFSTTATFDDGTLPNKQIQYIPPTGEFAKAKTRISGNDKAMTVLGFGTQGPGGVGVSTRVFGGRSRASMMALPSPENHTGRIEVKRDVVVTTSPIGDYQGGQF